MHDHEITHILEELTADQPGMSPREHEELSSLIHALSSLRNPADHDPAFASHLRDQVLHELAHSTFTSPQSTFFTSMRNNIRIIFGGAAVIALAVIMVIFANPFAKQHTSSILASNITVTKVGDQAFGNLSTLAPASSTPQNNAAAQSPTPTFGTAAPRVASMMAAPMISGAPTNTSSPATSAPSPVMMPIRILPSLQYAYTGDPFSQDQTALEVLKKVPSSISASQATAMLEQAGFSAIDLSSFSDLQMQNVTLSQNTQFGYTINIDLQNGTVSINQNYTQWPQGETQPLTKSDIPSDDAVIAIARTFLTDHSIPLGNYGTPYVVHQNLIVMPPVMKGPIPLSDSASAGSGSSSKGTVVNGPMIPYFPESEQVIYPLIVNGKNVYDTNGNQLGLSIEVDVHYQRVADVYGLEIYTFESSSYPAITSTSTILSMAEHPPFSPIIYNGVETSANSSATPAPTTVDLGTPVMAYEAIYQTDSEGNNTEFLVPAFAFPVVHSESNNNSQIMVPLISDFIKNNPPIRPIMYGATAPSSGAAQ